MSAKSDLDADYELLKKQHYKNGAPVIGVPVIADVSDRKAAREVKGEVKNETVSKGKSCKVGEHIIEYGIERPDPRKVIVFKWDALLDAMEVGASVGFKTFGEASAVATAARVRNKRKGINWKFRMSRVDEPEFKGRIWRVE